MKYFAQYKKALILSWLSLLWGTPSVEGNANRMEINTQNVAAELKSLPWQSIGLVMISWSQSKRLFTTGFFVDPQHFLVAEAPLAEKATPYCTKKTVIFSGQLEVALNFEGDNLVPTHECEKIIYKDVWRGFTLIKVKPLRNPVTTQKKVGTVDQKGLNLITAEEDEALLAQRELEDFRIVGFIHDSQGARLLQLKKCRLHHFDRSPFSKEDESKYETLKKVGPLWSSYKGCSYEEGLLGSPIFFKKQTQWLVVGIVGAVLSDGNLLSPQIYKLSERFGTQFEKFYQNEGKEEKE